MSNIVKHWTCCQCGTTGIVWTVQDGIYDLVEHHNAYHGSQI